MKKERTLCLHKKYYCKKKSLDDVVAGASFYKDNADAKLTGTLTFTGNAAPEDVADGKTFYNNDPSAKKVGTHVNPAVFFDVASGKPVLNLNKKNLNNQNVLSLWHSSKELFKVTIPI